MWRLVRGYNQEPACVNPVTSTLPHNILFDLVMLVGSGDPRYRHSTARASCRAHPVAPEAYQTIAINPRRFDVETYRLEIKSDRTWPRRRVSLSVPKRRL
jgi:hypothetical protein